MVQLVDIFESCWDFDHFKYNKRYDVGAHWSPRSFAEFLVWLPLISPSHVGDTQTRQFHPVPTCGDYMRLYEIICISYMIRKVHITKNLCDTLQVPWARGGSAECWVPQLAGAAKPHPCERWWGLCDVEMRTKKMEIWKKYNKQVPSLKLTFLHLDMDGWNISFLLGWPIFRCYVSFREGIPPGK